MQKVRELILEVYHYEKKTEYVKRIDPVKEYIIMKDDTIIRFHYIKELQGEIFNKVIVG